MHIYIWYICVCIFIWTKKRTTSLFLFVNKQLCYSRQNKNFSVKVFPWGRIWWRNGVMLNSLHNDILMIRRRNGYFFTEVKIVQLWNYRFFTQANWLFWVAFSIKPKGFTLSSFSLFILLSIESFLLFWYPITPPTPTPQINNL